MPTYSIAELCVEKTMDAENSLTIMFFKEIKWKWIIWGGGMWPVCEAKKEGY